MASSDAHNFSSSSPHRLPTLSASQALQNLSSTTKRPISTGLTDLDSALQGRGYDVPSQAALPGGIPRGEVTEIYGPPGVGKSAVAMQIAANVLNSSGSVVWVDAAYRLVGSRLAEFVSGSSSSSRQSAASSQSAYDTSRLLDNLHHFITPTLPHLLAILAHLSTSLSPQNTSLIVIDSISTPFALAFPKTLDSKDSLQTRAKKNDAAQWAAGRRWTVMGDFMSKIGKLAATRNIAVLLTSQTTTRIEYETGAMLHPAISGTAWDHGIGTRLVLFRNWMTQRTPRTNSQEDHVSNVRFAGLTKAKGVSYEGVGKIVAFSIERFGLREIVVDRPEIRWNSPPPIPPRSMKRKREENADSESKDGEALSDHEFGWVADDDSVDSEGLLD